MARMKGKARSGVSLIEILVVLAIIGILLALTAAALQKTVETQNARTSETQVFKLQQALDGEYERVVAKCAQDAANKNIPSQIVSVCDGDEARAKAVWTAINLRLSFPDSFAEVRMLPLNIKDKSGTDVYQVQRPITFAAVPNAGTLTAEEESGALLYMILAKRSQSGGGAMAMAAEDLTQASRRKVSVNGVELETFSDAFKQSVGFRRWEQTITTPANASMYDDATNPSTVLGEVQKPPYVDATKTVAADDTAVPRKFHNRDPLDPQGLVWKWNIGIGDPRYPIISGVYTLPGPAPTTVKTGLYFNGHNRMANVYSLGRSKYRPATTIFTPNDDILGFRLRKPGEKGYNK